MSRTRSCFSVLVVDDSEAIRAALSELIVDLDQSIHVDQASDGAEALDQLAVYQSDVVILDLYMPGIGGLDVLETIKAQGLAPLVIAFTSQTYPAYRQRAVALGVDYYFDKAADLDKLLDVLKQARQSPHD